ncbi:MAG: double zinc ribbon domain-containing protein [Halobacteriota archaeon]|uniref:double zinc ribbon domain-containing protein n=1 Tax=Natronomonas sp. TaxID=2184060 RepID=UPI0039771854
MEAVSRTLDIGPRNNEVLMIAAPSRESNWGPTGTQFGDEGFWVLDRTKLAHPNNTWIHEYVHTRQNFEWDESLLWLIEGTANYFAAWAGVTLGLIDFEWFYSHLTRTPDPDAILSDPETWASYQTKYTKGAVVTTALAAELLERSNGRVDLMDLIRGMCESESDNQLSIRALRSYFVRKNVPDLSAWLERYVNGTELPHPPNDPDAYAFDSTIEDSTNRDSTTETDDEDESGTAPEPENGDETIVTDSEEEPRDDEIDSPPEIHTPEEPDISDADCPICGASVDDDENFCNSCGTAIQRECFVCGGQAPGQEFCPVCGTELVIACEVCGHKQSSDTTYCGRCGTEL